MNEKEMRRLMRQLDDHLLDGELESMMGHIDIDVDPIVSRAQNKLERERKKVKRIKFIPVAAAIACILLGTTVVYASEISQFLKSFFGQSAIYSTVVEGDAYYLESPLPLAGKGELYSAISNDHRLDLVVSVSGYTSGDPWPDIKVDVDGQEMEVSGGAPGPNGFELSFFGVDLIKEFELIWDGQRYPVALQSAPSVADDTDIIPAEPGGIDWITVGFKPIDNGVQIFTSFSRDGAELRTIGQPQTMRAESRFEHRGDGSLSSGNNTFPHPLMGTDAQGNRYQYQFDPNDVGRPLTTFTSDAPADAEISLIIPSLVVGWNVDRQVDVALPALGEESAPNQRIDLGPQTLVLQKVRRTSATSATLSFQVQGGDSEISLWDASMDSADLQSGDMVFENGSCEMNVVFLEDLESFQLDVRNPTYVVEGNWTLHIQ